MTIGVWIVLMTVKNRLSKMNGYSSNLCVRMSQVFSDTQMAMKAVSQRTNPQDPQNSAMLSDQRWALVLVSCSIVLYLTGSPHFSARAIRTFLGRTLFCKKDLPSRCSISCCAHTAWVSINMDVYPLPVSSL